MSKAYLSLGSNIGDKKKNLEEAYKILESCGLKISQKSSFYETEPVGYLDQDLFVNAVIEVITDKSPLALLDDCQKVEKQLKRQRLIRWGPRIIDVDILLYDDIKVNNDRLIIPHKEMKKRGFVLIPLMEIAPDITIEGQPINSLIKKIEDPGVRVINDAR